MWKRWIYSGLAAALLAPGAAWAADEAKATAEETKDKPAEQAVEVQRAEVELKADEVATPGQPPLRHMQLFINGQPVTIESGTVAAPAALGEYWIGLGCMPADEELQAEQKLPEGQGLVVHQVVPESPAAKAEIQEKDILLKAGDKPLKSVKDLIDAVQATADKKLTIELLRDGKTTKIEVTPAKRPAAMQLALPGGAGGAAPAGLPEGPEWDRVRNWLEEMKKNAEGGANPMGPNMQFRVLHPGAILPRVRAFPQQGLPDDMSITVKKTGKKPAEIAVQQGDKKWEVTEESLDKLPKEVRPHVEQMLGRGPMAIIGGAMPAMPGPGGPGMPADVLVPAPQGAMPAMPPMHQPQNIERRLDEMNQRIERMHQMINELRNRGHQPPPPPPAPPAAEAPHAEHHN